jgi:hypothetical protein
VQTKKNVLEDVNVVDAILRYLSKSGISKLVQQFVSPPTQNNVVVAFNRCCSR